jgi:prepilin-type N-terminal cleavage/methylation domain-containing protein
MKKKMKKGFTLVEILIVLVVIGIILGVVLPNALSAIEQANRRNTAATLRAIDSAIRVCYSDKGAWTDCCSIADLTPSAGSAASDGNPAVPASAGYMDAISDGITYEIEGAGPCASKKTTLFPHWPSLGKDN